MLTIHLSNLHFYAHHGLYEEEKLLGAAYEVNVTVSHLPKTIPVKNLSDTIDYSAVYQLVKNFMQQPYALLETIVTAMAAQILDTFLQAQIVFVEIKKVHPPILSFQGSVGVSYTASR